MSDGTDNMDTRQLIVDTAQKMFADSVDKALLDAAEEQKFSSDLWQTVTANGFHLLGTPGSGTSVADMCAFLKVCGRFAVPLPLAETLVGNLWQEDAGAISGIGLVAGNRVADVLWGHHVNRVFAIPVPAAPAEALQGDTFTVQMFELPVSAASSDVTNVAGEPMPTLALPAEVTTITVPEPPLAMMALARLNQMAGGLQQVLELGLLFASERAQFGRAISKFQAIQHSLAVVAAEVAAAERAADAAVDALGDVRFVPEVAASKARIGEATGLVAEQVHQIHGAMGFTHEHRLHHYTRRLWAWRDSYGNEAFWQGVLGEHICALGADQLWDFIATRG